MPVSASLTVKDITIDSLESIISNMTPNKYYWTFGSSWSNQFDCITSSSYGCCSIDTTVEDWSPSCFDWWYWLNPLDYLTY